MYGVVVFHVLFVPNPLELGVLPGKTLLAKKNGVHVYKQLPQIPLEFDGASFLSTSTELRSRYLVLVENNSDYQRWFPTSVVDYLAE